MVKRFLIFVLLALLIPGCYRKPDHVPFEPFVSPEEINQRMEKVRADLKSTPNDNTLRVDYAELLLKQLEDRLLFDMNDWAWGPGSYRSYQNYLMAKRIDSLLSTAISNDTLNERALTLRLRNSLSCTKLGLHTSRPWATFSELSLRINPWPSYYDDTIPKTVLSLLRSNSDLKSGFGAYALAYDLEKREYSDNAIFRLLRSDIPAEGEMFHAIGADEYALWYGIAKRTSYSVQINDLMKNDFELPEFGSDRLGELGNYPILARLLFNNDMQRWVVIPFKRDEYNKLVMSTSKQLLSENTKLSKIYAIVILLSLKNNDYQGALHWIAQATREIPYYSLSRFSLPLASGIAINDLEYELVRKALDTLRLLDPNSPSIGLDHLILKYSFFEFVYGLKSDSLIPYIKELEKLELKSKESWGYLDFKIRVLECLLWDRSKKGIDSLSLKIWPGQKRNILSELDSSVILLYRRCHAAGYVPHMYYGWFPLWYAMHGFEERGIHLLHKLLEEAPEFTDDIIEIYGNGGAEGLALLQSLNVDDPFDQSLIDMLKGMAYLQLKDEKNAIPLLEKAWRNGLNDATQILFEHYINMKQYEKALQLSDELGKYARKDGDYYLAYQGHEWRNIFASKAYLLKKLGREQESDSIFARLHALYPEKYVVYFAESMSLYEANKFSDALEVVEKGLKNMTKNDWNGEGRNTLTSIRDSALTKMRQ